MQTTFTLISHGYKFPSSGGIAPVFEQLTGTAEMDVFSSFQSFTADSQLDEWMKAHAGKWKLGFIAYPHQPPSLPNYLPSVPGIWMCVPRQIELSATSPTFSFPETKALELTPLVSRSQYLQQVEKLMQHIHRGDIYEINYCIAFTAHAPDLNTHTIWNRLQCISPMPFSAFIDHPDFSIISASPERFVKKTGNLVTIQPMKGTIRRGETAEEDALLYQTLQQDAKEKSENVMIVDLTRNDLSHISARGQVKVKELFGVYTYPHVHQMISTVECTLKKEMSPTEIWKEIFPMGSMTGAPKKRAMELIDQHENFKRGPYSGMLGYVNPDDDFDFNVLIRTIFYDKKTGNLMVAVGSAITSQSVPEKEYEECFVKLQPLLKALNATLVTP